MDDVDWPPRMVMGFNKEGRRRAHGAQLGFEFSDGQSLIAKQPSGAAHTSSLLVVAQRDEQATIAEVTPLSGKIAEAS